MGGKTKCAGIGNVCTRQLGGYSKLLMTNIVHYFFYNNVIGILFCKDALVGFYSKYSWKLINTEKVILPKGLEIVNTMVCNIGDVYSIVYNDRNF